MNLHTLYAIAMSNYSLATFQFVRFCTATQLSCIYVTVNLIGNCQPSTQPPGNEIKTKRGAYSGS